MTSNANYLNHQSETTSSTNNYFNYYESTADTYANYINSTTSSFTWSNATYYQPLKFTTFEYIENGREIIETEEGKIERLKLEQGEKERVEKLRKEKEAAEKKARELLLEYLDEKNKKRYFDKEPLVIESKLLNDISYHIPISYSKIKAIKNSTKETLSELCITVNDSSIPLEDNILTKLLYATNDEHNMLKSAKHWNAKQNLLALVELN